MLIYIIIFIYCLTRKVLEEPKPQRSWDLSPHPRGCQTCSVIQRSSQRRDRTPCATPKLEPTDPSLSAAHGRQLGGALKFWTLLMNIENMLQNQTASLTMEHIYWCTVYIYIHITYWFVYAWFTGVSGIQKAVCCQRDISRVIFGFKSTREVLLAGTWDTDSEPVLDEPATRVLVLKGQVHR